MRSKSLKCFVEGRQLVGLIVGKLKLMGELVSGFEANVLHAAPALHPAAVARVIAQDVAHGFRGDGEEMRATSRTAA